MVGKRILSAIEWGVESKNPSWGKKLWTKEWQVVKMSNTENEFLTIFEKSFITLDKNVVQSSNFAESF